MEKKRKDINALSATELADYIHALSILRERSTQNPDDETGYDFQAALHNDAFVGPCEHGSDLFLPWHRAHLHYFEQLLQQADPPRTANVTIPYWDWLHVEADGAKFPAAFAQPGLVSARNQNAVSLPADTLGIVMQERVWEEFGGYPQTSPNGDYGRLELGPHNYMHPQFIGGKMASPSRAAEDPIYWSFHCFIDLLWAEWQRRNQAAPSSPDATLRGFLNQPLHRVVDFHDPLALGYGYELSAQLQHAFGIASPVVEPLVLASATPLQPLFAADVATELRAKAHVGFALPATAAAPTVARVRLHDLQIPVTGSYQLRAYVHPRQTPFAPTDTAFNRLYYAGYIYLWRAHAGSHDHGGHGHHPAHPAQPHHPTSCIARFEVTKFVSDKSAVLSDWMLTLQYLPAPGPDGEPLAVPDLVKEVKLKDVLMEVYQ